ncbi:MAG: phosphoenolpyruvate--protein phosphotransferase [Candidatus Pacebacteria bacterium]|nr:phosphoenolpyruvate--protein phosphotransferase [Candidatus Paceibacterota bacterium]
MPKDNVDLICDVAEIAQLFEGSKSLDDFLQTVVDTVADHMRARVCSIYLYEESTEELVLSATHGLRAEAVGSVRLKLGEGITGMALKELRPICESQGSRNPNFKFIPGIEEERYAAFLAVPIMRGLSRVGAMVIQHDTPGYFRDNDIKALRAIASQLASAIENAKLLMSLHRLVPDKERKMVQAVELAGTFLRGTPGSEGIARGAAVFYGQLDENRLANEMAAASAQGGITVDHFETALKHTEVQLEILQERTKEDMEDLSASMIFSAHILMLKDDSFSGRMRAMIADGTPAPGAIRHVVDEFVHIFSQSTNPRIREKVQDVLDLGHRLLLNLSPDKDQTPDFSGCIVIAGDLLPSDIIKIVAQNAEGLILTQGTFTAHVSILARSLSLPLVVVKDERLHHIPEGDDLLMDADQGTVYIRPGADVVEQYESLSRARKEVEAASENVAGPPFCTRDGASVQVMANINLLSELKIATRLRAEGIGLYRSEFPFVIRNDFPSEEEQYRIYRSVCDAMDGQDTVFRTLDIGGDKMLSYFPSVGEANPFLGLRAIRFSLRYRELFAEQLRALLRAGHERPLHIMFPLISSVDDFLAARAVVQECIEALRDEKATFNAHPKLGVMVELPSAVEMAGELAHEADFLSVGTNDLIQYMLAVDRTNQQISDYYVPFHPAVLRALKRVVDAALQEGVPLSVCGEMAVDPLLIPFLLGIGVRKLSVDVRKLETVRATVMDITLKDARTLARRLLTLPRVSDVSAILEKDKGAEG